MATAEVKRVLKIGGSLPIILPKSWGKGKVKPGEEMVLIANGELRIFPVYDKDREVERGRQSGPSR